MGALLAAAAAALGGCARPGADDAALEMPPVGVPGGQCFVVEQAGHGPIVLIFPGRSAPTDDPTLGIRRTGLGIAARVEGSVAIFSWRQYRLAREWLRRQADARRERGEPAELALVGHSWGGQAAGELAREALAGKLVDRIPVLVTIDAIRRGYVGSTLRIMVSALTLEGILPHRLKLTAFRDTPAPDGKLLVGHVNYYQLDSPCLCGAPIPTASENHEVWLDTGREPGHGNLDNLIAELVAEDVRRAFIPEAGE